MVRPSNKPSRAAGASTEKGGNQVQNLIAHSDSPQNLHSTSKVLKNTIAVVKIRGTRDPPPCTFRYTESLELPPQTVNVRELKAWFFLSVTFLFIPTPFSSSSFIQTPLLFLLFYSIISSICSISSNVLSSSAPATASSHALSS